MLGVLTYPFYLLSKPVIPISARKSTTKKSNMQEFDEKNNGACIFLTFFNLQYFLATSSFHPSVPEGRPKVTRRSPEGQPKISLKSADAQPKVKRYHHDTI